MSESFKSVAQGVLEIFQEVYLGGGGGGHNVSGWDRVNERRKLVFFYGWCMRKKFVPSLAGVVFLHIDHVQN